ncbi:hypothetical protein RchiOBHm_Chr4g0405211 [Rosa chinensis]|uniref:Uncharacterized protein n=1 Tax=Rosa chinensis TaxID=74649 RepID=A0A2P6QU05_ROSCH|nr:hypothetical protein RchiOBHm_Chr4g0405211 [Rosa chinensis]
MINKLTPSTATWMQTTAHIILISQAPHVRHQQVDYIFFYFEIYIFFLTQFCFGKSITSSFFD